MTTPLLNNAKNFKSILNEKLAILTGLLTY
jgi:hypothetical protein